MKKILIFVLLACLAGVSVFATGGRQQAPAASAAGTWSGEITFAPYMFGPWDPNRDIIVGRVQNLFKSKYGLDLKFSNVYVEYTDYEAIINTRIAGGMAPDMWLGLNEAGIRNYYNQGVIASWDVSFFQQHAPNITAYINKGGSRGALNAERWWKGATIASGTGKMVTLPSPPNGEAFAQKGVVYRGDWLRNLGVTNPPSDMNEWIALMRRFVNEDPDRNGRKDTYAFSSSMIKALFTAHGMYTGYGENSPSRSQWYLRDGRIQNADTLPQTREVLELCARLYAEGLIDPTFVATEYNRSGYWAISQPFVNGQIGVSSHASFNHYRRKEVLNDAGGPVAIEYWAVNGEGSDFVFGPWIKGPYGYGYFLDNDYGLGESYVYNKALERNQDKLATIFRVLDIFGTDYELMMLACYGIEGQHYTWSAAGAPINTVTDNPTRNALGIQTLRAVFGPNNTFHPDQNEFWYKNPEIMAILNYQKQPYWDTYLTPDITGYPPSTSIYSADLFAYRDETYINIITGRTPISYFDTYVREYMNRGGRVLEEEANAMYREQTR